MGYEHLRPFCTVRGHEILDALEQTGTQKAAAEQLGIAKRNVELALQRLRHRAAAQGVAPEYDMTHQVPFGFRVKGVSTYYSEDGTVRGQWVKSTAASENQEQIRQAFLDAMRDEIKRIEPAEFAGESNQELLNVYIYGDPHIGLRTWEDETDQNHDLDMAERLFTAAHADLVKRSPAADTAIILNLGDYFHSDDGRNMTLRSGHPLDLGDGRYQKVRKVGFKILRAMIDMALRKHQSVIVWNIQGNHDEYSAIDLSLWLEVAYENEPRVNVCTSPNKFYFHQHGLVMLAAAHGDTVKPDQMLGVMAADRAEMWGGTKYRYAHLGHVHHKMMKDLAGVAVESHRVLQPNDLYAHTNAYRSQRDATCITYHARLGEYARVTVNPSVMDYCEGVAPSSETDIIMSPSSSA